jgi:hypothetical protein
MALLTDHQHMMAVESVYGTPVVVTRALPMMTSSSQDVELARLKGSGLLVGSLGYQRGARTAMGIATYPLQIDFPAQSKGIGLPLSFCAGTAVHGLVAGSTFQTQLTPTRTTPTPTYSFTYQTGIVETTSTGTSDARTYAGCTVSGLTITVPENGEATISIKALAKSLATGTALATPSYATTPSLYHHDSGSAILGTGVITAPTATTLGSVATTSSANIRAWEFDLSTGMIQRPIAGAYNQPVWGMADASLKVTIEYDGLWWQTAMLAGTPLTFIGQLTGAALSTGVETLQVFCPTVPIDPGVFPKPTEGDVTTVDLVLPIEYDGTNQPWYISHRTSDAAL